MRKAHGQSDRKSSSKDPALAYHANDIAHKPVRTIAELCHCFNVVTLIRIIHRATATQVTLASTRRELEWIF